MAGRKRASADLTGIRQRGDTFQVRIFGGTDPVTGKQVMLTGSADSESAAIQLRDRFREQVRDRTAVRTTSRSAICSTSGSTATGSSRPPARATPC